MDLHNDSTLSHATQSEIRRVGWGIHILLWATLWIAGCAAPQELIVASTPPPATTVPTRQATPTARPPSHTPSPTIGVVVSAPSPTFTRFTAVERRKFFRQIWRTVKEHYVYEDFNGADWANAEHGYDERIAAAPSTEAFYEIVREAIDTLNDDHSRFDSPQDVAADAALYTGTAGYAGIGVMLRDVPNEIVIIRIAQDGPADRAGVRIYDTITAIDGRPVADFIANEEDYGPAVRGPVGTTVTLSVRRGTQMLEFSIVRNAIPGDAFPEAVARIIPGTAVQLLTIDSFNRENLRDMVVEALDESITPGVSPTGLIIDVRENGGGSVEAMSQIIGLFVNGGVLGQAVGRNDAMPITVESGHVLSRYSNLPIVVLTGEGTVSAAEMFASGMKSLRQVTLIGTTTAGNTENLYPYDFDDGSVLWLAEVLFRQNDGTFVDNIGVIPDITVPENPDAYEPSNDPVIQAALQHMTP